MRVKIAHIMSLQIYSQIIAQLFRPIEMRANIVLSGEQVEMTILDIVAVAI